MEDGAGPLDMVDGGRVLAIDRAGEQDGEVVTALEDCITGDGRATRTFAILGSADSDDTGLSTVALARRASDWLRRLTLRSGSAGHRLALPW